MIALILETIDKCSQWKSMRHLAHLIGEDSAGRWNDMINYLYLLLGMVALTGSSIVTVAVHIFGELLLCVVMVCTVLVTELARY